MSGHLPPPPAVGADTALFLDFDGTLVEIAATPEAVRAAPGLPVLLEAVAAGLGRALAIVSGRRIADLDGLLAPFQAAAAGLHGLELRRGGAEVARVPAEDALETVRPFLRERVAAMPRVLLEDKGLTIALHYRQAPEQAEACVELAAQATALAEGRLSVLPGKMVVELRPPEIDKGKAIEALLAEAPFAGRVPVFVGDDFTDEEGFAVVNARGGYGVFVGENRTTIARYRLEDVGAVHDWLARSRLVLAAG
jgi:trehalose 6-phosphate phosphatase